MNRSLNRAALGSTLLMVALAAGCAPSLQVYSHQSQSFGHYATFALSTTDTAPPRFRRGVLKVEAATVVGNDVNAVLSERGYHAAASPDQADLIVRYGVGEHAKVEAPKQSDDATGASTETEEKDMDAPFNYTEQTLVVDIFDAKTSRRVWHGVAREILSPDKVDSAAIEHAVRAMMAQFPTSARVTATAQ